MIRVQINFTKTIYYKIKVTIYSIILIINYNFIIYFNYLIIRNKKIMVSSIIKKSHINIIKFVSFSSLKTNQKKSLLNPILTWPDKQLTLIKSYNYALKF
jgi:hypothetical protein